MSGHSKSADRLARELNLHEGSPDWVRHLNSEGYAVVPNILTPQECDDIIDKAWQWLEALGTGIRRGDPTTWTNDRWPENFNGIIQQYRIGHAPFTWQARTNENVIGVFKEIWGTEELLTSFDAMCILRPAELVKGVHYTTSPWFHTDQAPKKKGFHCVQGILNLEEVTDVDASLACYPKSHRYHEEMFQRNKEDPRIDYYTLSKEDLGWVERDLGLSHVRVPSAKGGFIAFDSRLLHCNFPAKVPREKPRWRYVLYICMTPRAWADRKTLRARVDAFRNKRMTTHWPHHVGLFPEGFHDVKAPDFPLELSDVGKRLVGMQDYQGREEKFEDDDEEEDNSLSLHDRPTL